LRFLLFFPLILFALEININYSPSKKPYEVLTITNNEPFKCKENNSTLICEFNKVPKIPVFSEKSRFFEIKPVLKKKFFLTIKIKGSYKVFYFEDNLYNKPLITPFKVDFPKKVVIIANEQYLSPSNKGLNFYYKHTIYPYIGAIDENLRPIKEESANDIEKYFEILRAYKRGQNVLDEIDYFVEKYPDSVFLSDVLYLKLKILDKENQAEEVISLGKEWIKKFAYSPKLPEVLLIIGKNYAKIGLISDATYFFNRVITEYENTKYAYLAMIYLADQLYNTGDEKKAFKLYEKVLYSTKDLDVASLSALRLAEKYLDKGDVKKAFKYYQKIYEANKGFLLKDKKKAYELAKKLATYKMYDLAIKIGEDLLKRLKKLDDLYEVLLYNLAVWSYEANDYKKSLYFINKYLKEFPYGDYIENIKSLRDKVLFEVPEQNLTKKLQYIDKVLSEYKNTPIAKKALVEKIKTLYKLKRYQEILDLEKEIMTLPDNLFKQKDEFLREVALNYAKELLDKDCAKAIEIIKKYKLDLINDKVYKCAMKIKDCKFASAICNKFLNNPDDKVFVKWMKRKIEALWCLRDYKNIVKAVDDLCQIETDCYKYKVYKFFALWNLGKYKEALKVAKELEKYDKFKNAEVYIKIVNLALQNKDYLLAATYAKKIISLQEKYKTYPYSPFVDFIYAKYTKNKKEAIKVLKNLLPRVKGEDKARAYFMLANLTGKKEYLQKCLNVKDSKLWRGLCKDALNLF